MRKMMVIVSMLVLVLFVFGCANYKTYEKPQAAADDTALVDEIAQIEKQLQEGENKITGEVTAELNASEEALPAEEAAPVEVKEEEVILPELKEQPAATEEPAVAEPTAADTNIEVTPEVITTESSGEMKEIHVKENELVKLNVKVTDPNRDRVTYTFSKPINIRGEWKTNYGDAGEYIVTITATDGKATTERKVKLVVERVNMAPIIGLLSDIIVKEGATVRFEPTISDLNKDPVTVTISEPLKSGTFVTDHTSSGEYNIKVDASDGEMETSKNFKLTVLNVNQLPEISGLKEALTIKEGEVVRIEPKVVDPDGDRLNISISQPVGSDGVWETSYTDHGQFLITVTASDGKDRVSKSLKLTVEPMNMPPVIEDIALVVQ